MLDPRVLSRPGTVLLDTARSDDENRRSWCFTGPRRILRVDCPDDLPSLLETIEDVTEAGGYVAGYLSYEAGYSFVDLPTPSCDEEPLAWFGVYDAPTLLAPVEVDRGLSCLKGTPDVQDVRFDVSRDEYVKAVERIQRHIADGDVYQINYTAPVHFQISGDPRVLYRRLRRRQHVPYAAYLNLGPTQILSCSPELFLRQKGSRVVTRPMKGTIRRGRTLDEDRRLQERLSSDPKNRAENLMIVDLLRNDLSVCCESGSVEVPELYETEPYDTVTQMTSTVEGRLRQNQGLPDLLRALFPCGSVTGAPKRRAMRLIRGLEPSPRGVYCGAIGMAGPESAVFNVAIRTAVIQEGTGRMGIGSGIVWDSSPEAEYEECALKTQFLTPSTASRQEEDEDELRLIETMRFDGLRFPMLDRHVARLERSADYFGYPFDADRLRRAADRAVGNVEPDTPQKVRITLDRWGRLDVTVTPVAEAEGPWALAVASERVDRSDPYFYHKTTKRGVYDRALREARAADCEEALLLNEEGEITEGTYSNIFIRDGDRFLTPPVECGLLAGVYRDYVLEVEERAQTEVLMLDDLQEADAIYCCNAVRGWCPAQLRSVTEPAE